MTEHDSRAEAHRQAPVGGAMMDGWEVDHNGSPAYCRGGVAYHLMDTAVPDDVALERAHALASLLQPAGHQPMSAQRIAEAQAGSLRPGELDWLLAQARFLAMMEAGGLSQMNGSGSGRGGNPLVLFRSGQVVIGTHRLRIWVDHSGLTLDVGRRRITWCHPRARLLYHQRRHQNHWYGRVIQSRNPHSAGQTS